MEYRLLGRSDISVSVIGFGCGGNARLMTGEDETLRLSTLTRAPPALVFGQKGVAAACRQLVDDGVVGIVGFTAFGGDISAITRLIHSGAFGVLNVSLNLLNPSAAVRAPASFSEPNYDEIVNEAH